MRRLVVAALLVVAAATTAAAVGNPARRALVRPVYDRDRILTILVIGSDIGPPARPGDPLHGRSDAIHLVAVDTRRKRVTMVDIPRDSYIAGDKVNAHMAYGGPDRLRDVLEDYTGVAIDHFAVTTFQGLRAMVDAIGGVKVDIPSRMADPYSRAYFDPGLQRLTGQEALSFVRNRKSGVAGGDFGRTHNQGVLLRAAHAQLRKTNPSLGEMARFVAAFAQYTETDIPIPRLFKLATLAMAIKPSNVRQESLSGGIGSVGGASVVYLSGTEVFADINNGRIGP